MDAVKVTAKLVNVDTNQAYEDVFLVNTAVAELVAPGNKLEKLGVERVGKEICELPGGREITYDYGLVRVELLGKITAARVFFGPPDVEPLLGWLILEAFGIVVEPETGTLRKVPALPLKRDIMTWDQT